MTREELIEQMAKAAYDRWNAGIEDMEPRWDQLEASFLARMIEAHGAALLSLEQSGFMIVEGWKPIETAPENGERILIYHEYEAAPHIVMSDVGWWRICREHGARPPSGWMPLPSPPQATDETKEAEA